MAKQKSERHHWWPECVSKRWRDRTGFIHWLLPDGEVRKSTPKNLGAIGNGHFIKLDSTPGEVSPWDQNFEGQFQRADARFPAVIDWLEGLEREPRLDAKKYADRFLPQDDPDDVLFPLIEGMISLAVRSPMNRENAVRLAENLRGKLKEPERNRLIALNMRDGFHRAVDFIGTRGKFVVLYSPDREFIFGDGFFHNIALPFESALSPKILVPVTPRISVMFVRPMAFTVDPRLLTIVVTADETGFLNRTVQVYARQMIFYRSDKPTITDEYRQKRHLQYLGPDNPIERFIEYIPGVPIRDRSLDHFFNKGNLRNS